MEPEFDWLAYGYGVASGLVAALILSWRRRRARAVERPLFPAGPVIIPPELHARIRLMKAQGKEIDAIALVRKALGCDLKTAKDAVDALR